MFLAIFLTRCINFTSDLILIMKILFIINTIHTYPWMSPFGTDTSMADSSVMDLVQNEATKFEDDGRGPAQNERIKLIILNTIDKLRNLKKKRSKRKRRS